MPFHYRDSVGGFQSNSAYFQAAKSRRGGAMHAIVNRLSDMVGRWRWMSSVVRQPRVHGCKLTSPTKPVAERRDSLMKD
jgi:hypothetical protein